MSKPIILIIDDEPEMCWAVEKAMKMEGFDTVIANDGQEGLEKFAREDVAVVLVDWKMPGMSGMEVISKIRESDKNVPIIMITGHGSMDVAHSALLKDATGYIIKPFSMVDLRATVKKMVSKRS